MPRTPRFGNDAVADLLRQVRYAPKAVRRRQMDRAETLLNEIEPAQHYPRDYIVYRVTGYRPDRTEPGPNLTGDSLLADLSALITALSRGLDMPANDRDRRAIDLETAAARLGVSTKTIQRYRRRGLVCHVIRFAPGSSRLGCYEDALERFAARHEAAIGDAAGFTRIDSATTAAMVGEARTLRETAGISLNEAARRIADQYNRAHETVRGVLQRHDRDADQPIFDERGPLTERQVLLIERAHRMGMDADRLAARFGKSTESIYRAARRGRLLHLAELNLNWIELATFAHEDAADVILRPRVVRQGLRVDAPTDEAIGLIEWFRTCNEPPLETETARLVAFHLLKRRAAYGRDALDDWPAAGPLDAIETDLRWAAALKRRMVLDVLPPALRKIELTLGRSLTTQPGDLIRRMLEEAVAVSGRVIESHDPTVERPLWRIVEHAMDRRLAQLDIAAPHRAAALHASGGVAISGLLDDIFPGQRRLELSPSMRAAVSELTDADHALITARFGLDGSAPQTIAALVREHGTVVSRMSARLRRIEIELRRCSAAHDP